jgi:hypothetical protein
MADIESLLVPPFPAKHISAAVGHFVSVTEAFGQSDWERCIARSGNLLKQYLKPLALIVTCHLKLVGSSKLIGFSTAFSSFQINHSTILSGY